MRAEDAGPDRWACAGASAPRSAQRLSWEGACDDTDRWEHPGRCAATASAQSSVAGADLWQGDSQLAGSLWIKDAGWAEPRQVGF